MDHTFLKKVYPPLQYATSTIADGNMSLRFGDTDTVIENRKNFLEKNNIDPKQCVFVKVTHEDVVVEASSEDAGAGIISGHEPVVAEALITNAPDLTLALLTADCLPVALVDTAGGAIGLAHCGWKPTDLELLKKVLKNMQEVYGTNLEDVYVSIGPGIHQQSYVLDEATQKDDPRWKPFIKERTEGYAIDLLGYNRAQLISCGIPASHVYVSPINTAEDGRYFSHYKAKRDPTQPQGRFVTILGQRKNPQ